MWIWYDIYYCYETHDQCYLQHWNLILCYYSFIFVHTIVRLSLYGIAFPFSIGDRNFCDLVVRIDTANSIGTVVECTFFQREYTCTIDYGTDPSYTNLVYRNTSYILCRMATITLSQELRGDTTYYYIVSAESDSQCLRVRGSFRAGRYRTFGIHTLEGNGTWEITWLHKVQFVHHMRTLF